VLAALTTLTAAASATPPVPAEELRTHEAELEAARSHQRTRYRSAAVKTRVTRFDVRHRDLVVAHVVEHGAGPASPATVPPPAAPS
jgi:hypothetical protein